MNGVAPQHVGPTASRKTRFASLVAIGALILATSACSEAAENGVRIGV